MHIVNVGTVVLLYTFVYSHSDVEKAAREGQNDFQSLEGSTDKALASLFVKCVACVLNIKCFFSRPHQLLLYTVKMGCYHDTKIGCY